MRRFLLRTRHWNPSLDIPAIVRAGVPGLGRALARVGVTQRLEPISEGADEPATIAAFGQRLDEAVRLAGGRATEPDLLHAALRATFERVGGSHTAFLAPPARQILQAMLRGQAYAEIGILWDRRDVVLKVDDAPVSDLTGDEV